MLIRILLMVLAGSIHSQMTMAQRPLPTGRAAPASKDDAVRPAVEPERLSDAERISRLQRGIDETQSKLGELKGTLNDPNSEYKKSETEFGELDGQFGSSRKELEKLKSEGVGDLENRESALADLEKKRSLARERFDLAIRERKKFQDQVALLEQKLQQDRDALHKLTGAAEVKPAPPVTQSTDATTQTAPPPAPATDPPAKVATPGVTDNGSQPVSPPVTPAVPNPAVTAPPAVSPPTAAPAAVDPSVAPTAPTKPPNEKIVKAQEKVTTKQAEAEEAQQQAVSITQRLESIKKVIENEKALRGTAREKADNARKTLQSLEAEADKKLTDGTPWAQLKELNAQIDDAQKRLMEADIEIRQRAESLDAQHTELVALQADQIAALEEAKSKMEEAEAARAALERLKNPFAPENIWNWIVAHGPIILATIISAIVLLWLIQVMEHRMIRLLTRHGVAGTPEERESRARTLAGVLQNAFTVIVVVGAILLVAAESGFNITALLGATAVIGLAVAFGAQNLIRDFFYGFMILMENQYLVNDVVRLGSISGQVERITLRITILRDLHGTVHFVPHGQITTVSNLTRGWSRVVLDVGVAYKEDVDRVMKVLADLGKEMRRDPAYRDLILDEPEISGVDALADSAVVIRFLIKTRPLKQWVIKREMLRRIKNKFDEVGIEIPFPHQMVYNRFEPGDEKQARLIGAPGHDEEEEWSAPHSTVG